MPELVLRGVRSLPLVGYLKAVGLLRIASTQIDAEARGRWRSGTFELSGSFSCSDLAAFFLEGYAPTPVVSPWNGGSGFYPKDNCEAIEWIERSDDARFAAYRAAISASRETIASVGLESKPDRGQKLRLVRALRARLPDQALAWLDAALIQLGDEIEYPPLLGSGGNDGHYDFSNNFARAAVSMLGEESKRSRALLGAALGGGGRDLEAKLSMGHFLRDSSPVNSPKGEADALGNPWDLLLSVEGALVFTAAAARRHQHEARRTLVSPFTAFPTAAGYGSSATGEKGRRELWMPLWSSWAQASEVIALVREGRARVGSRQARSGLDFVRAAGSLGVARGIDAFERYAILERAGQSSLAVPAGRIEVRPRPSAEAIATLDRHLDRLGRILRGDPPRSVQDAIRALERSVFAFADSARPEHGCEVLERLGRLESALTRSAGLGGDVRPLSGAAAAPWLESADDGSVEFELAVALGSLREGRGRLPAIRDYLHGTEPMGQGGRRYPETATPIAHQLRWERRLAALHSRRFLDAADAPSAAGRSSGEPSPGSIRFRSGVPASLAALRSLARMEVDGERVLALVAGLSLLDWWSLDVPNPAAAPAGRRDPRSVPLAVFDLLLLAFSDRSRGEGDRRPGPERDWPARLAAGALGYVIDRALLSLGRRGLVPLVDRGDLAAQQVVPEAVSAALLLQPSHPELLYVERALTTPSASPSEWRRRNQPNKEIIA